MGTSRGSMLPKMVLRSLLNNARISVWTLLTLATCAALVTLFTTVTFEIGSKMSRELRRLGANAVAYPGTYSGADWTKFDEVVRNTGANAVQLAVRVGMIDAKPVAVVAADADRLAELTPYWAVTGRRARAAGECQMGQRAAKALGLKLGQEIDLNIAKLNLVGMVETGDEDEDRVFVTSATGSAGGFRYALVSAPGGEQGIGRLQQALALASTGIELKPLRQVLHGEKQVLEKINVLFAAAMIAVLALTAMGVSASMLARVVERRREFALLRAIGAKRRSVAAFLLAESATVGVAGALIGFGAGTALAALVVRRIFHVVVAPQWTAFAAALGVTTLVALLAGAIACARTLQFQPAAALRGE